MPPCGPTAIVIERGSPAARSPTRKPMPVFSIGYYRRLVVAKLSGRRKNSTPAHSITRSPETEMLRLISFVVFLATWWIAAVLAGGEKLPAPPAVLTAIIAAASSGALFFNLGVTLAR